MNPLLDRFFKDADHPFARSASEAMSAMRKWILSFTFVLFLIDRNKLIIKEINIPGVEVQLPTAADIVAFLLFVLSFLIIQYLLYAVTYTATEFSLFLAKRRSELFFDNLASFIDANAEMKSRLDGLRARDVDQDSELKFGKSYEAVQIERLQETLADRAQAALFEFIGSEFQISRRKAILGTVPLVIIDSIKVYTCIGLFAFVAIPIFV